MTTDGQLNSQERDHFLIANLTDSVDRLRYTYKTQEKAASRYSFYESFRKWGLIACTALATGAFVTSLFALAGFEYLGTLAVGLLAMLATFSSYLGDVLDFSKRQQEHHEAGARIRSLFVRSEVLLSDYLAGAVSEVEARKLRDELQAAADQLLLAIPRTTRRDYEKADKALVGDERTSVAMDAATATLSSAQPGPRAAGGTR